MSDRPTQVRCVLGVLALLSAACGSEAAPWDPFYQTPAGTGGGAPDGSPSAGAGAPAGAGEAAPPQPWPESGTAAPAPPRDEAGSGAPLPPAAGSGGMPTTPVEPPSTFRITELFLRDPHFFVAGTDVTDTTVAGMSINRTVIPNQLTMDSDRDGAFDVSTLLIVQPFDPRVPMGTLRIVDGLCPLAGGACRRGEPTVDARWTLSNAQQGACLAPVAGTLGNYRTPITQPMPPCFVTTDGQDLRLNLGGTELAVSQVKVSATYQPNPKQLLNGLLQGFVTNAAAMSAILPREAGAPAAGMAIANFVRSADRDDDQSPTGQPGFFIYFNFVAKPVEFTE